MKQIWPNYSYSPTTNVLTLTGLNIDRDQLLLVTAADRGRIMYNFADSSVTASAFTSGANTALTLVATTAGLTTTAALVIYYDDQLASTTVTVSSLPVISGTVTANAVGYNYQETSPALIPIMFDGSDRNYIPIGPSESPLPLPISGTITIGSALPAGTAQIGSVTASISNSVTIGSLPLISGTVTANINTFPDATTIGEQIAQGFTNYGSFDVAISGTANVSGTVTLGASTSQIGSVTASISNSVVTFYPLQGTTVSNTNFTSTTASTTLVSAVAGREVLTVFNEGAGNLHISPGATATTISYQVRLSPGDYWECPNGQLSLAHTAVFATAGTARVTQVS